MTVDVLSSIKDAKPSESVNELFTVIKNAVVVNTTEKQNENTVVSLDDLRDDQIIDSSEIEKQLIIENFPREKNRYLIVAKIIEE